MTVYLHYQALNQILMMSSGGIQLQNLDSRSQLQNYRHSILQQFSSGFDFKRNAYGKPISSNDPNFSFNHSHSKQNYALALSKDVIDIGVDIEDFSRKADIGALAQRYFHPDELLSWYRQGSTVSYWLKIWTIKEAILKAHGLGIRLALNSLNTQAHPTWDFGVVEHPLLGQFAYQCLEMPESMLTVAYRWQERQSLQKLVLI